MTADIAVVGMRRESAVHVIGKWEDVFGTRRTPSAAAVLSVLAHLALITAFVGASGPSETVTGVPDFRPVFYLPPPNRPISQPGGEERVKYVTLGVGGTGAGERSAAPSPSDLMKLALADPGTSGNPTAAPGSTAQDDEPVFSVVEVDEEAARMASSAAPAYPPQLLAQGVEGAVIVRYVVDADGLPDSTSLQVVTSSRHEFAEAVRAALPHMRFTPARIDNKPVRQLVEQPFTFRIERQEPVDSGTAGPARRP